MKPYRKGCSNSNADALLRLPATNECEDRDEIISLDDLYTIVSVAAVVKEDEGVSKMELLFTVLRTRRSAQKNSWNHNAATHRYKR